MLEPFIDITNKTSWIGFFWQDVDGFLNFQIQLFYIIHLFILNSFLVQIRPKKVNNLDARAKSLKTVIYGFL